MNKKINSKQAQRETISFGYIQTMDLDEMIFEVKGKVIDWKGREAKILTIINVTMVIKNEKVR